MAGSSPAKTMVAQKRNGNGRATTFAISPIGLILNKRVATNVLRKSLNCAMVIVMANAIHSPRAKAPNGVSYSYIAVYRGAAANKNKTPLGVRATP
jgi:hypothetical protein